MKVRVQDGRLVLVDATRLPNGTVLELVVDDEGDDLDARERRALNDAVSKAWKSAKRGNLRVATDIIREMRKRR